MATNKIEMYLGNSETFEIEVIDQNNEPVPITGAQIIFTVKQDFTDEDFIFQRKNSFAGGGDSEIIITDADGGLATCYLIPSNTSALMPGSYVYDVWVKLTSGYEKTIIQNVLFIKDVVKK